MSMEKIKAGLFSLPEAGTAIHSVCHIPDMQLKATNTTMLMEPMDVWDKRDTISSLREMFPEESFNLLLYKIKASENGIVTDGEYYRKCYALDVVIYLVFGDGHYNAVMDIDFLIEPSRGALMEHQWRNVSCNRFSCLNKMLKNYKLQHLVAKNYEPKKINKAAFSLNW